MFNFCEAEVAETTLKLAVRFEDWTAEIVNRLLSYVAVRTYNI